LWLIILIISAILAHKFLLNHGVGVRQTGAVPDWCCPWMSTALGAVNITHPFVVSSFFYQRLRGKDHLVSPERN
jgi:hypothetical protein